MCSRVLSCVWVACLFLSTVDVVPLIRTIPAPGKKLLVPVLGRPHLVLSALSEEYTKGLKVHTPMPYECDTHKGRPGGGGA